MSEPLGLRERKKLETRQRLLDVAQSLFDERGFERVPVAEIARRAGVSEATAFNYFPIKEDFVFGGMESYETAMLAAIAARPTGTSVAEAFRDYTLTPRGALAQDDAAATERIAGARRVIAGSPLLQAHEQKILNHAVEGLAHLIEQEGGDSPFEAWIEAHTLMGVNQAMTRLAHSLAAEGLRGAEIGNRVRDSGRKAFDRFVRTTPGERGTSTT